MKPLPTAFHTVQDSHPALQSCRTRPAAPARSTTEWAERCPAVCVGIWPALRPCRPKIVGSGRRYASRPWPSLNSRYIDHAFALRFMALASRHSLTEISFGLGYELEKSPNVVFKRSCSSRRITAATSRVFPAHGQAGVRMRAYLSELDAGSCSRLHCRLHRRGAVGQRARAARVPTCSILPLFGVPTFPRGVELRTDRSDARSRRRHRK